MAFPRASRALDRFTVLDLTRVRAGPTCVRELADWGANVIKIEMPPEEQTGDALGGPREGPDFQNLHRNKRSLTLNLKKPEAVAALKRIVESKKMFGWTELQELRIAALQALEKLDPACKLTVRRIIKIESKQPHNRKSSG